MQKPDADGYVTITWPSNNIPHGGIFHTQRANTSADQQQFLKVLLEESKLDIELRRKDKSLVKHQQNEETKRRIPAIPRVRPRTSRRRSLSAIRESGALDVDDYRPLQRGEDREKLKEKLAYFMQHGDSAEQTMPRKIIEKKKSAPRKLPSNKEMWNDLVTQIRERAEWLAEMEYLGQADPHRDIIKEQIAERMRALDALGVDSKCSSARSTASGFSTTRSREITTRETDRPLQSAATQRSNTSTKSQDKNKRQSQRNADENISAYQLSPLQYSPRRRV